MAETLMGKNTNEAKELFEAFHSLLTQDGKQSNIPKKLAVFSGVREFPMRVKCATLAWHTVIAAIEGGKEVTTE